MSDDVPGMSKRDLLPLFGQNSSVMPDGELFVGGVGVRELAAMFGTPAYIVDEAAMRHQARRFRDGLAARFPDSEVIWASKSFPCLAAYRLFAAEGFDPSDAVDFWDLTNRQDWAACEAVQRGLSSPRASISSSWLDTQACTS